MSLSVLRRSYASTCGLAAIAAATWVGLIATGYGGPATAQAVSNVGLAVAALAAAAGCAVAAGRNSAKLRRVWALLGLSCFSWGMGMAIWTWYESVLGRDPFPSLADVGYLGAVPFAAAALLSLPTASQTLAGRIRTVIDGLMIAGSLLLISWVLVLSSLFRSGGDALSQAISVAYPLGDVVVVTIVLYVFLRARRLTGAPLLPLGLIGGGLAAIAAADFGFVYLTATEAYASGNLIDAGWFLGYTLILLAALKPAKPTVDEDEEVFQDRPLGMMLPYVAVGVAMVVSSVELFQTGGTEAFVAWTRTFIVVLMIVRQILTVLENLSLTRHLEARVEDRTAELRASEQRFQALVQHSSDVVTIVDVDANVLYQSESIHRVFGYTPDWVLERPLTDLLDDDSAASLLEALDQVSAEPYAMRVLEVTVNHEDGHGCQAEMTITNLLENPSVEGLVLNTRDISEQKALEHQLVHEAFHDSLTTLANRALFKDRVEHALRRRHRKEGTIGVLFLDLDGFKEVNDSLGHAIGDELLILVAQRLSFCVRPGDTVARLGGDEFAVLIEDADSARIGEVAERMTDALREPFAVDGHEIHVRGSIGISTNDAGSDEAVQLLRNADLAMYRAKANGDGGVERYDPDMHADLIERLQLGADLRRALESDELVLYFQPTLALSSGAITGVEALIRWQHPLRGLIEPARFIPLAEDRGLIHEIGDWVLKTACRQAVEWQQRHPAHADLSVSVNISGRQLKHADLVVQVAKALQESGLEATHLVLEITESVLMEHTEENLALLRRLRSMGVRLAIDDFGTGYSSLSYLHRFPVDMLKIDRSFVDRLRGSAEDAELVRTIVRLGQSLGMTTVAEGIEDHAQFLALKRLGCEQGQGFHFSRPLPVDQIDQLLGESDADAEPSTKVVRLPRRAKRMKEAS